MSSKGLMMCETVQAIYLLNTMKVIITWDQKGQQYQIKMAVTINKGSINLLSL